MQFNILTLSKKAIDAALKNDWDSAILINEELLDKDPEDKDAQIRLGRAYIKTKKFAKAKKIFASILKNDPINQIAKKNYQLASEKNKDSSYSDIDPTSKTKALIKEPGTSTEAKIYISKKLKKDYVTGELLDLKINKTLTKVIDPKNKKILGNIDNSLSKVLYQAKKDGRGVDASFIKENHEYFTVLLRCKCPVFKSEKQLEKPYMKGVLDDSEEEEAELEVEEII